MGSNHSSSFSSPVQLVGGYTLVATLWILVTDGLVRIHGLPPDLNQLAHSLKGLLFVLLTSTLLYRILSGWQAQRLRAESALVESESRLRQIADNLQDVFWLTDPDKKRILFVSSAYERVWGQSCQELYDQPHTWLDSIHEEDRPGVVEALPAQALGGYDLTYRIRTRGGEERWIHDRAFPISDENGKVFRVAGVAADITRERRHAEAVRESEEKYRCLVDLSPEGVAIQLEGTVRFVNPAMLGLFAASSKEQLEGLAMMELVHPDQREEASQVMGRVMSGETVLTPLSRHLLRLDGSDFQGEVLATPFARDGKKGALVIIRDVSERNRNALALEHQRSHLQAIVQNSSDCVIAIEKTGLVNWFNPRAEECFGCASQEARGRAWTQFFDIQTSQGVRASGERFPAEFSESTVELADGPVTTVILRDISSRLGGEQKRKELEQQLRQAQKMEALGLLAGGVAHDFNNLLTVMQGAASLIEPARPQDKEFLEEIRHACQRAADLTRRLLTFSRKQVVQLQDLDLSEVFGGVSGMLRRVLGEEISLTVDFTPNLPNVRADAGMLEQVLVNLVVNSRDALNRGGAVTIRTFVTVVEGSGDGFILPVLPGRYVCLEVEDNGTGIDPKDLPHIFEPFFTTKEVGKGTGLGLATIYGILEQHEGGLQIVSQPGQGTRVRVLFPALSTARAGRRRAPDLHLAHGSGKVLVAEDDPALQGLVRRILGHCGYEVATANNGPQALELWRQQEGDFDFLVTDLVMPEGLSGLELARELLKVKPELKVIYTSGYSPDLLDSRKALTPGDCFLAKPYTPAQLAQLLHDCQSPAQSKT
ncbi:MAG: PAS domain S-box protein [Vulcanimicrobiota bacterium]